jgi:lipid II:glycine glycyltransferase (peptidoglycan interpeptide bridge formation enzyme)
MIEARVLKDCCPDSALGMEWENLVKSSPESGFMQSLHWRGFKQQRKMRALHIGLFQAETLIGGALFYTATNNKGAGFLVAPEGPVLPWSDEKLAQEAMSLLIKEAESQSASFEAMAIRVEPRLPRPGSSILNSFGRAPFDLIPQETLCLDLKLTDEEIFAQMKPKGRYNIRLSQRKGLNVYSSTDVACVKQFYAVMEESASRDHFLLEPFSYFVQLAQSLFAAGMARFVFVEHEGDILATMLLVLYGGRATYFYGGITNKKRNLMAGYALQWEAMRIAKQAGCSSYDFFGFDQFRSPNNAYARFSQFKSMFGGRVIRHIGAQDYFFTNNLADAVIRALGDVGRNMKMDPSRYAASGLKSELGGAMSMTTASV